MKIKSLTAVNFRNYEHCHLQLPAMINIFFGSNAQGKTNFLEALYFGACGLSHRTVNEEELCRLGSDQLAVALCYSCQSGDHNLKIKKFFHQGRKKEVLLDDGKIRPKEHYGVIPIVFFSPEDLQLIKGEPAQRRRWLDMQLAQSDPVYYDLFQQYNKVLQQRNRLLKDMFVSEKVDNAQLVTWDQTFSQLAAALLKKRLQALAKFSEYIAQIYQSLSNAKENLNITYEMKLNNGKYTFPLADKQVYDSLFFQQLLNERRQIDLLRGSTGIGPHRDDLLLSLDGISLKAFGSQGQQRSAAISLKLSQLEYCKYISGEFPILLLDDVMSELDVERRNQLLDFIDEKIQTFITVNDRSLIQQKKGCTYFLVENGEIKEV